MYPVVLFLPSRMETCCVRRLSCLPGELYTTRSFSIYEFYELGDYNSLQCSTFCWMVFIENDLFSHLFMSIIDFPVKIILLVVQEGFFMLGNEKLCRYS